GNAWARAKSKTDRDLPAWSRAPRDTPCIQRHRVDWRMSSVSLSVWLACRDDFEVPLDGYHVRGLTALGPGDGVSDVRRSHLNEAALIVIACIPHWRVPGQHVHQLIT